VASIRSRALASADTRFHGALSIAHQNRRHSSAAGGVQSLSLRHEENAPLSMNAGLMTCRGMVPPLWNGVRFCRF
jgi:hypothetical protein